ncbi:MAG: threonine ammonia-lyase [Thermoprotei archaeon]
MKWTDIGKEVQRAEVVLKNIVYKTPLDKSNTLSRMTGGEVYLKLENLQKTGAFKVRGAYYKIHKLSPEEKARGVIAASAGNHAQGVAYASTMAGIKSTIVMPVTTPPSKINATKSYGAEVVLHGAIYDESYRKALEIADKTGSVFIHPFDDPYVIAGNGTIGLEIIHDLPDVDVIIVPVGGGGLISGIASIIKSLRKNVKIIGVEPESAPKFTASLKEGHVVEVKTKQSLADGLLTKKPGNLTFEIVSEIVDDIVTVSEDEIAMSMVLLMERAKTVTEGAGASSVAALLNNKINVKSKKVVALISGGNADLTTLYKVIMRGLAQMKRITTIKCILPDMPGTLKNVVEIIASERGNIIDIFHSRIDPQLEPVSAEVQLLIEIPEPETINRIEEKIRSLGYSVSHPTTKTKNH